jgi:hypothetical protein
MRPGPGRCRSRKSARARFSASGVWRARMASNFSGVISGRARTRARWTSAGPRPPPPCRPSSRRRSRTAGGCRARRCRGPRPGGLEEADAVGADQRVDDRFQHRQGLGIAHHGRAEPWRGRSRPSTDHAGKGRLDRRDGRAAAGVERVDRRVGVVDRHALVDEHRRGRRLAHADRSGQAQDQHRLGLAQQPGPGRGHRHRPAAQRRRRPRNWGPPGAAASPARRPCGGRRPRRGAGTRCAAACRPCRRPRPSSASGSGRAAGPSPPPRPSEVALITRPASASRPAGRLRRGRDHLGPKASASSSARAKVRLTMLTLRRAGQQQGRHRAPRRAAGARGSRPARRRRRSRRLDGDGPSRPGPSVLSAWIVPSASKISRLAAPASLARSLQRSAQARARSLNGNGDVEAPDRPATQAVDEGLELSSPGRTAHTPRPGRPPGSRRCGSPGSSSA